MKNSFLIIRIMVGLMLAATVLSSCVKNNGLSKKRCTGLKALPSKHSKR